MNPIIGLVNQAKGVQLPVLAVGLSAASLKLLSKLDYEYVVYPVASWSEWCHVICDISRAEDAYKLSLLSQGKLYALLDSIPPDEWSKARRSAIVDKFDGAFATNETIANAWDIPVLKSNAL